MDATNTTAATAKIDLSWSNMLALGKARTYRPHQQSRLRRLVRQLISDIGTMTSTEIVDRCAALEVYAQSVTWDYTVQGWVAAAVIAAFRADQLAHRAEVVALNTAKYELNRRCREELRKIYS